MPLDFMGPMLICQLITKDAWKIKKVVVKDDARCDMGPNAEMRER